MLYVTLALGLLPLMLLLLLLPSLQKLTDIDMCCILMPVSLTHSKHSVQTGKWQKIRYLNRNRNSQQVAETLLCRTVHCMIRVVLYCIGPQHGLITLCCERLAKDYQTEDGRPEKLFRVACFPLYRV